MKREHLAAISMLCAALGLTACHGGSPDAPVAAKPSVESRLAALEQTVPANANGEYVGFDRNGYPGDNRLVELHQSFAFAGYWLNNPPGETKNNWVGKRQKLRDAGFGFLVLWNGRIEAEIKRATAKGGLTADALGKNDAAAAIAAAKREGFPAQTILFLDQEEGARLTPVQDAYFFGWTEAVAASGFRPGAYVSGKPAPDGNGPGGKPVTITTAQNVKDEVAARHLHPVVLWVVQDQCPPAPGCTLQAAKVRDSGTIDAEVWQYALTPREPELTRACVQTYAKDGSCYAGATTDLFVDLDVAKSSDPSHGR
jgi:hypothetical protein